MKHQRYYPTAIAEQGNWNGNFADKLPAYQTALGLSDILATAAVADARYMQYYLNQWLTDVRAFSQAATQALETLSSGTGSAAYMLPVFSPPQLPPGNPAATPPIPATVPVAPGALNRIFDVVQIIKRSPGYSDAIGDDLDIIGVEDSTEATRPSFTAKAEGSGAGGCNCVKIRHKRYGHYAVAVYSKRGTGDFELLGISAEAVYMDERPLMVPGQPEIRQYKLRFWDAGAENGDWTDIVTLTVSP